MAKMSVIEFAEMRMEQEERNECYDLVKYWSAYRDGAMAQKREDCPHGEMREVMVDLQINYEQVLAENRALQEKLERLLEEVGREHPEKRLHYETSVI